MNKNFIKYLISKLKTGNLRSIHLNALPGRYATRLDVTNLDIIDSLNLPGVNCSTSELFLFEHLLKKASFQFKINLESVLLSNADEAKIRSFGVLAKRLSSLESENEDNFLEHGIQTFGFGYPLLIKKSDNDPTKIIKAPLLIWNLDIERSHNQRNQWIIKRTEDSTVYLNEVLLSHLSSDGGVTLNELNDDIADDNVIDNDKLGSIVDSILEQLGADDFDGVRSRLQKANDKDTIERLTNDKPWIMWSGIFGLYRTQKQSIIRDTEKLLAEFDNFDFSELRIERFLQTTNSCVEIDPSQGEILTTLESNEYKVIQGPPGTGKSQSLTAIISNVLENQGKILVVCEKRTALEVVNDNLEKAGLKRLVALIEDVNRDRKGIIDTVRQVYDIVRWEYQGFNEEEYDRKLGMLVALREDFDARNSNLNGLAFRGMKFRDLIAKYLELKRLADNDLFSGVNFQLTDDEFGELEDAIQDAVDLHREVDQNAFVFDILQSTIFSEHYSNALKNEIFEKLQVEQDFLRSFDFTKITVGPNNLKTDTLSPEMLSEFDFDAFQTIHQLSKGNLDFWTGLVDQLSAADSFITSSSILGSNPVYRSIYSLRNLFADITRMRDYFESVNNSLGELKQSIDAIPASRRLQPLFYHWSVPIRKYFGKTNKSVSDFWACLSSQLERINDASDHLFFNSKKNLVDFLSVKETANFDSDFVCNEIQKCIDEQQNFREYFQWRRNKEKLAELPKSCVSILASSVEPKKWIETFQYAYYARLIEKLEIDIQHFNENDSKLKRIAELETELRESQKHKILKAFGLQQFRAINDYNCRGNIKWLFNYRKNTQFSRKNSLRRIIHQEFDLFTALFPVLLVTPTVASSILPLTQSAFDVVLFDEASQLRLEDTFPAVVRGRIKVISGDKHQMPPSNYFASDITLDAAEDDNDEAVEDTRSHFDRTHPLFLAESESLLDFGNNNNPNIVNTSFLDFHYRSRHPYLIDFSNAAFYGLRLVPMPEKEAYCPITLVQVNGTYESTQTNQREAEAIVEYIKEDFPVNEDGTYPSLGIATFNIQQRNLIKERLHECSYSDASFRKKLELIGEKEELFVKNLENIQGDERDVIILSTTFGLNAEGRFRQSFGPLNTGKGHRLLNVIVTRAKDQVIVFTSIPETVFTAGYQDALPTHGNRGKAIFYAYLDYCRTVSEGEEERRQEILSVLAENCEEQSITHNHHLIESPFEQEVFDYLRDYIKSERIVPQFKLGGFRVDFMILAENNSPSIAIECDGARWHSSAQAWAYDIHRQRILENQGLKVIRIWSKTWFPDPEREVKKIVSLIQKFEPSAIV